MDWKETFLGFDFNDEAVIRPCGSQLRSSAVRRKDGDRYLDGYRPTALSQFVGEAGFVGALEQTGTEFSMHCERGVNYRAGIEEFVWSFVGLFAEDLGFGVEVGAEDSSARRACRRCARGRGATPGCSW